MERKVKDSIVRLMIYMCASLSVILLVGIIVYVLFKGLKSVNIEFLTTVTSVLKGTVGIAGNRKAATATRHDRLNAQHKDAVIRQ